MEVYDDLKAYLLGILAPHQLQGGEWNVDGEESMREAYCALRDSDLSDKRSWAGFAEHIFFMAQKLGVINPNSLKILANSYITLAGKQEGYEKWLAKNRKEAHDRGIILPAF